MKKASAMFRWIYSAPLVLASASPRRKMLLATLGLPFTIVQSGINEPLPEKNELPAAYAARMAKEKCYSAQKNLESPAVILAADTVVTVNGAILGKPGKKPEAMAMLEQLNGATHQVYTAVHIAMDQNYLAWQEKTEVTFMKWPVNVLENYVKTGECADKAGGYAIQGNGAFLVESISGSWTNVVGLPLTSLVRELTTSGCICPAGTD